MDNSSGGCNSYIPIVLVCLCGTEKDSIEELDIHIKVEHLKWLPYGCAHCKAQRPTGLQMHEHLIVQHPKEVHNFHYNKNADNERLLVQYKHQAIETLVRSYAAVNSIDIEAFINKTASASHSAHKVASNEILQSERVSNNSSHPHTPSPFDDAQSIAVVPNATPVQSTSSIEAEINAAEDYGLLNDFVRMKTVSIKPELEDHLDYAQTEVLTQFASALTGVVSTPNVPIPQSHEKTSTGRPKGARAQLYCTFCSTSFNKQVKLTHAFLHYMEDKNILRFRCIAPDCTYQSKERNSIAQHIRRLHDNNKDFIEDLKHVKTQDILDLFGHYIIPAEFVNNPYNQGKNNLPAGTPEGEVGEHPLEQERVQDSPSLPISRKRLPSPSYPVNSNQTKQGRFFEL